MSFLFRHGIHPQYSNHSYLKYSKLIFKIKQILITNISGKGPLTCLITVGILWDHVGHVIQQIW